MSRIFPILAVVALAMLAANFFVGLWIGDFNAAAARYLSAARARHQLRVTADSPPARTKGVEDEFASASAAIPIPRGRMTIHFYLGVASSLLSILVCSIGVTYFIGTSRWCREVVETYQLSPALAERSADLKRRTFPYSLLGMLAVLAIVTLGGLSDPTIPWRQNDKMWINTAFPPAAVVQWHYVAAIIGLCLLAGSFWVQAIRIAANYKIIGEILAEVQRIRSERGLPHDDAFSERALS